jgi:hypothetical protein
LLLKAQKAPVKFGKVEDAVIKMVTHPLDSSADAVILMDYGVTTFRYDNNDGFYYQFNRITRIKVLTKAGLDYGDFEIPFYHKDGSNENVSAIKGYTYNYAGGTYSKSKLEKSSVFREESSDNWGQMKVSMPDVRIGSVIEFTYTITSPFIWNLITWEFQDAIPTVYSEYRATIPEYFDYQLLQSGYHLLSTNEHTTMAGSITMQTRNASDASLAGRRNADQAFSTQKIDFMNNKYRWVARDVPAFIPESYVASSSDYLTKIEFELRGTKYPNQPFKAYMGTWQSLNKTFLERTDFGKALNQTGFMKADLAAISNLPSEQETVAALIQLVRNQIKWNGRNTRYASTTLRQAWQDKKGGTGDINLTIVAGLRKLGFTADPVLISTRGHGMIRTQYAISSQFNAVIALVELSDGFLLLDGTDNYLPAGVLPKRCLNGQGWRVSENAHGWVPLSTPSKQEQMVQGKFDISSSGILNGTVDLTDKGYAGYASHKSLRMGGEEKFFENFQNKNSDWLIDEYEYHQEANPAEPFISRYVVEMSEDLTIAGDRIYFNPTLEEVMVSNPFKLEKREYPVDFAYPFRKAYMFRFTLPDDYEVEELPESAAFQLPGKDGLFRYNISSMGNELQIMADFRINKVMFAQTEYAVLKQFYHQVVQKCAEQVVLKKTSDP